LSFEIEILKEHDVEASAKALQKSMADQSNPLFGDVKALERAIYGPHVLTLIAKKAGSIVGLVSGTASLSPSIVFLGVTDPESAREGLGNQLIDRFIDEVKKKSPNAAEVRVTLPTDYTDAVALYSSKGFAVMGFVKTDGGRDMVFLSRRYATKTKTPVT
jgi:hypothetical protein